MPSLNHIRRLTQAPRLDGHLPEPYDPGSPPGKPPGTPPPKSPPDEDEPTPMPPPDRPLDPPVEEPPLRPPGKYVEQSHGWGGVA
ncbi:hypothetical protein PAN31117_01927 [Pandoraea anapnoica]|uniref:Uncharacterized protein n=1 Tax=Pandoraea anapnoica TaxID=2508301 RepID=A0A5E4ZX85_9BURK|nr:hypothetical protein [Pandoraea anapnoica]VVE65606.1 hypothetical protein PAN31117_01927 [Pandoraea anapnoica]